MNLVTSLEINDSVFYFPFLAPGTRPISALHFRLVFPLLEIFEIKLHLEQRRRRIARVPRPSEIGVMNGRGQEDFCFAASPPLQSDRRTLLAPHREIPLLLPPRHESRIVLRFQPLVADRSGRLILWLQRTKAWESIAVRTSTSNKVSKSERKCLTW